MRGWPNDDSHPTVLSPRKMKLLSANPTRSRGVFCRDREFVGLFAGRECAVLI